MKVFPSIIFIAALTMAVATAGLFSATTHTRSASRQLHAVVTDAGMYDVGAVTRWWSRDARHLGELVDKWPFSVPTMIGEMVWFAWEHHQITRAAPVTARGYAILPPSSAGKTHVLAASIRARAEALTGRWDRNNDDIYLTTYKGHPLSSDPVGIPADVNDVAEIVDGLAIPDGVLAPLQITVLPFVLEETAGLGLKGEAIIGAAPLDTPIVARHRTAYTIVHELGHHVHLTYFDATSPNGASHWNNYVNVRGIPANAPSNPNDPDTWRHSPEENFAEDFRVLFGPPEARTVPHGTVYDDPHRSADGGTALRNFMLEVLTNNERHT